MATRSQREQQIQQYLATLGPNQPVSVPDLQASLGLKSRTATRELYQRYEASHDDAPRRRSRSESQQVISNDIVLQARQRGLGVEEIAAANFVSPQTVVNHDRELIAEGKIERFRAVSPLTRRRFHEAVRMLGEGMKKREIADALGMHAPDVVRLLRTGGRRYPKRPNPDTIA